VHSPPRPPTRIIASAPIVAGLACAFALALFGCGSNHHVAPIIAGPKLPVGTPENTSPDSTVQRLMVAYQYMAPGEYDTLLTSDFHYHFSAQTDPALVSQYGNTWGKVDEGQSMTHLTQGFTNAHGVMVPKASSITSSINGDAVGTDTTHSDSTSWYRAVSVTALLISIDVPSAGGGATYNINTPIVFLLVRGDAAVLNAGQSHSASRWYIREMDDLMLPLSASKSPHTFPVAPVTWGSVRAGYL